MSLDVYLELEGYREPPRTAIFVRENGSTKEVTLDEWNTLHPDREPITITIPSGSEEVYSRNITHNLTKMADAAGIYNCLWRPDENGFEKAAQLIEPLKRGLERLRANPELFTVHNPSNGWGSYEGLLDFVGDYLEACVRYPEAIVRVSR